VPLDREWSIEPKRGHQLDGLHCAAYATIPKSLTRLRNGEFCESLRGLRVVQTRQHLARFSEGFSRVERRDSVRQCNLFVYCCGMGALAPCPFVGWLLNFIIWSLTPVFV
jgi:hypothetical protein